MRTLPPVAGPAFADAALLRRCGIHIDALQLMSPEWSLKANLSGEIQTVLSLQPGPIIEEWTKLSLVSQV